MVETVLIYIENEYNEYLMIHKNKRENDYNLGKYLGIGGHIESGETPNMALIREVKEEVGINLTDFIKRGTVLFINDSYQELMHLYIGHYNKFKLGSCNEGDLAWVNKNNILSLPLWEGDVVFLNRLINSNDYFDISLIYENDKFIRSEER